MQEFFVIDYIFYIHKTNKFNRFYIKTLCFIITVSARKSEEADFELHRMGQEKHPYDLV